MDAASAQKFLSIYFRLSVGLLLGIVVINAVVDPLWVYHAPWLPQSYVEDQRQANPGLARFCSYDCVVIGNSLTENLLTSEIQTNFGWQPIKLCISGSTAREQHLILDQALATGQVRDVLWSIDFFAFDFEPNEVRTADFPFHLYDRGVTTPWKYLLSASTLINSFKVTLGGGDGEMEQRFVWHHKMKFGMDRVLRDWRAKTAERHAQDANEDKALRSARQHLFEVIASHPDIRFHLFVPPYSALYRVMQMVTTDDGFASHMRFKREVARTILRFPNVELFDFETAAEITHDLDNYTDLVHFNLATSTTVLRWIAEGQYRLEPDSIDERIQEIEQRAYEYGKLVFAPDNPLRGPMQIDEKGLRLPDAIMSAVTEVVSKSRRIAVGETLSEN